VYRRSDLSRSEVAVVNLGSLKIAIALMMVPLSIVLADPATRSSSQPSTSPVNWFAMTADQFAKCDAANLPMPWENHDPVLLSVAILHETNRHRIENKLQALRYMPKLDEAALMHATDMSNGHYFSHVNENDPQKREVIDRVKLLKLSPMFVGENIIMEYGIRYQVRRKVYDVVKSGQRGVSYEPNGPAIPPRTYLEFARNVCQRWMDSPTHRQNMLTPHARFLGAAAVPGQTEDEIRFRKFYCVQVFFAPMPKQ